MKTSIATAVSIAGVLAAGGAAFAVNSHVMDPAAPGGELAATATFAPVAGGLGATATTTAVDDGSVSKDGSGNVATTPDATTIVAPPVAASTPVATMPPTTTAANLSTTFKVGSSGTVIASAAAGVVTIDSVSPAKGWSATRPRPVANGVEVDFISGSTRVDFIVRLSNGTLTGAVNSRTVEDDDRWDNERHHDDDHDDDHDDHDEDDDHDEHEDDD